MKRRIISVLMSLFILVCSLPQEAFAFAGDIWQPAAEQSESETLGNGKILVLKNRYLQLYYYVGLEFLATIPTAAVGNMGDLTQYIPSQWQTPRCNLVLQNRGNETYIGGYIKLKNAEVVNSTPHGSNAAIKLDYDIRFTLNGVEGAENGTTLLASTTVYHELVRLSSDLGAAATDWGVLTTVEPLKMVIDENLLIGDFRFDWDYRISGFAGMGHSETAFEEGGPAIKMSRTTVSETGERTTEEKVITSRIDNLSTKTVPKGWSEWGDIDGVYITEIFVDGYPWANPFVGLSDYYDKSGIVYAGGNEPLRIQLPMGISVRPSDRPNSTYLECKNNLFITDDESVVTSEDCANFLWGFRGLITMEEELPTEPDEVSAELLAKRLAVFKSGSGVAVEYVADDNALKALKEKYGTEPVAQINGDYKSLNGSSFEFTGGAAMLSPTVSATWNAQNGGKFIVHNDGRIEQSGVNLNAPTFKFYQPQSGAENLLSIELTENGFEFGIDPQKNEALVYIDIPYTSVKIKKAVADNKGNLVFSGDMGFQTVFEGASFQMERLGYGLKGNKFKVNGVEATGSFDTAKLLTLELAEVNGKINTFSDEYSFELKLNAFELFKTEASLGLKRSNKGALIPDELWFYLKAGPGIILIPPVPIGRLNGGGAGFKDLAATVNGDYFAIPPLKLRGALTGTYLHLIEGTGNVVIGPSEISLKATDVNLVGAGEATRIVDSFGYSLKLNGQNRTYRGTDYKGIYFGGSKELALKLPSTALNIIELDSGISAGAFGGVNEDKSSVYLAIGANGMVKGTLKIPDSIIKGGVNVAQANVNLVIGGQTVIPIRGVSVDEGLKSAFENIDVYIGAMAETKGWAGHIRAWVIVPKVLTTKFRKGAGWDVQVRVFRHFPEWEWSNVGIEPLALMSEDAAVYSAEENSVSLLSSGAETSAVIDVVSGADEDSYILLTFDKETSEEQVKAITVLKNGNPQTISWDDNSTGEINARTEILKNKSDGNEYRVALLCLGTNAGGTYSVEAGGAAFKHEETNVTPFEKLNLSFSGGNVAGRIDYAESGEKYVLRTYLANSEGGADYIVDEREISDPENISVEIPSSGTLAPTGEYYVTSFLMQEKQADINEDGVMEDAFISIANQAFSDKVNYSNVNQPAAPQSVAATAKGNEVMRASWDKTDDADGYALTIYQKKENGEWINTGFGYDVDKDNNSIDMALTVGGNGVEIGEGENGAYAQSKSADDNLEPNKNYKVGVKAYKIIDGGKYFSAETQSAEEFLPEYTPIEISVSVNQTQLSKNSESKVFEAFIGGGANTIEVASSNADAVFSVTRMDTDEIIAESNGVYSIPDFEGTLMFRIDGVLENSGDITSEFLLVSCDKTPPMLSLSSEVFFADKSTGEYKVTGTADAGSEISYGGNETVFADASGAFEITQTLAEGRSSASLCILATDEAGNVSQPQIAIISRKTSETVTVLESYAQNTGSGEYNDGETVNIDAGTREGFAFAGWVSSPAVTFADSSAAQTSFVMPNESVTVTATWRSSATTRRSGGGSRTVYHKVTFETNGGSEIKSRTVENGAAVNEPAAPSREGFEFDGWFTDKELKTKFNFSDKITGSITLYAKWVSHGGASDQIVLTIGQKEASVFGKTVLNDVAPKIVNDRTMLPARFVAESLGAEVDWNGENKLVTIKGKNLKTNEDVVILITIGAQSAFVNGKEVLLDSPAFIENDRTYTPIRFISEELGASVSWEENEKKVIITKNQENQ